MELRGVRTRQTTRRSNQPVGGDESEEEVRGPQLTSSSPRRKAPQEEEIQRAQAPTDPRPRRSLRCRGVNVREEEEKKEEERVEEKQLAIQSATPSSSQYPDGEKEARSSGLQRALRRSSTHTVKEDEKAQSTKSRRAKRSGRRSSREEEEVRSRSTGKNAQQDQEEVRPDHNTLGPNSPEEDEMEVRGIRAPGAKHNLNQSPRKEEEKEGGNYRSLRSKRRISRDLNMREEEEVRLPMSLRPKSGTSGDAKVQGATPVNAKSTDRNSRGEGKTAPAPGTTPRRGRSSPSGDGKVRKEEKRALGTMSCRRVASAQVECAIGGEDEETPRIRDATPRIGAGNKVPAAASDHLGKEVWGEEKLVRRSQRLAPNPSQDAANSAPDSGAQQTVPINRSRPESPPAASYTKKAGEKETREEDEDWNMVQQLLRLKNQIKQQLLEYKVQVETSKVSPTEECTEDDLIQKIEDLERKMEEMKIELEAKTLALKRIQVAHAIEKKLEKKDDDFEPILAIMKNILTVNGSILKAQQVTRDLEEKMLEVKKKRLMFKKTGEEKVLEIKAENKRKKDELNLLSNSPLLIKMKKNLQKEIDTTIIIQNVFQHIVMAAKIDWAADPALKALILQFEKNLNFI